MSDKTGIEWTDATWNPVRGCSRVSEGCRNCYAERQASRFENGTGPLGTGPFFGFVKDGKWTGDVALIAEKVEEPLRWRKPRRIFVNSMSDLFHEKLADRDICRVFDVMMRSDRHTFQVLTKRPERMRAFAESVRINQRARQRINLGFEPKIMWPLPNVWLGVSVEDQKTADERIPLLLRTPAAVRFVSYEPALGPADFRKWIGDGDVREDRLGADATRNPRAAVQSGAKLSWVIAGGESGPYARHSHPAWFRDVRDQCGAAGVPFFFKQWGEFSYEPVPDCTKFMDGSLIPEGAEPVAANRVGRKSAGRLLDGREWNEFPEVQP